MAGKITIGEELMFPSDYVSAPELKGKDVTLTIASVSREELWLKKGGKKRKPVFTFKETEKKLVCNPTNGDTIASMYGTKAEEWVGKRITLYPTTTNVGTQKNVPCIRVRDRIPPSKGPTPPQQSSEGESVEHQNGSVPARVGIGDERATPPPRTAVPAGADFEP